MDMQGLLAVLEEEKADLLGRREARFALSHSLVSSLRCYKVFCIFILKDEYTKTLRNGQQNVLLVNQCFIIISICVEEYNFHHLNCMNFDLFSSLFF